MTQPWPIGAHELLGRPPDEVTELGEVLLGSRPARNSAEEITLYKSVGNAVEDLAAARLVYESARAARAGATVEF